ncbi:MAG: biopolymer transporter ExbD, partial [Chthoniobacterales bacterium]
MRRYSERNQMHTLTELNVTPLLDLAFVLLIIFMITTPLIENSVDLIVPTSAAAKSKVNPADVQTIAIDRNKTLKLNEVEITNTQLEQKLTEMKAANP